MKRSAQMVPLISFKVCCQQTFLLTAVSHFIAKQQKKSIPKTEVLLIDFLQSLNEMFGTNGASHFI